MNTRFFKLNDGGLKGNGYSVNEMRTTLDDVVAWDKAEYAKLLYWVRERSFFEDVETPDKKVSIDEFQSEEGQKKEWNRYLKDLISAYENGTLFSDKILADITAIGYHYLITNIGGREVYLSIYNEEFDTIDCTDVTEEYTRLLTEKINPGEIERFVNQHTADEIKEKYSVPGNEDFFWDW